MNDVEKRFIEQYKITEAELNRRLDTRHGMTDYIAQMEATPVEYQLRVPTWRKDYRSLKHLRWLRNCIVHDESTSECDRFDIVELCDFHQRLLNGSDPVASAERIAAQRAAAQRAAEERAAAQRAAAQRAAAERAVAQRAAEERAAAQRASRLQAERQTKASAPAKAETPSGKRRGGGVVAAALVIVIILLLLFFAYRIGLFRF